MGDHDGGAPAPGDPPELKVPEFMFKPEHKKHATAMVLGDVSWSTQTKKSMNGVLTNIYDHMCRLLHATAKADGCGTLYLTLYSGDNNPKMAKRNDRNTGAFVVPTPFITFAGHAPLTKQFADKMGGRTCPWSAITEMLADPARRALAAKTDHCYIVSDGMMNGAAEAEAQRLFTTAIREYLKVNPRVTFTILIVEDEPRDYTGGEEAAAGCDMWRAFQSVCASLAANGQKFPVRLFKAQTPNHQEGVILHQSVECPKDHAPFGDYVFPVNPQTEGPFRDYVKDLLKTVTTLEQVYEILQNLVNTLDNIIKIKGLSKGEISVLTHSYSQLFMKVTVDTTEMPNFTPELLVQTFVAGLEATVQGKVQSIVDHSVHKKQLFSLADTQAKENGVFAASGGGTHFITFPMDAGDKFLCCVGSAGVSRVPVWLNATQYPDAAIATGIEGKVAPCLPLHGCTTTEMNQQVLRQMVRAIVNRTCHTDVRSNTTLYIALLRFCSILKTDLDPAIHGRVKAICQTMLSKLLAHENARLYQKLCEGRRPEDTGGSTFEKDMKQAINIVFGSKSTITSLEAWYTICTLIETDATILSTNQQTMVCKLDDPAAARAKVLAELKEVQLEVLPDPVNANLEYECPITGDDTTATGGFRLTCPIGGCAPPFVLSPEGHGALVAINPLQCLICRHVIPHDAFVPVEPKVELVVKLPDSAEYFGLDKPGWMHAAPQQSYKKGHKKQTKATPAPQPAAHDGGRKIAINLRGAVGAGKSSTRAELVEFFTKLGYTVHVGSPDDINKCGRNPRAGDIVRADIYKAMKQAGNVVIIIDTCGESVGAPFGIQFSAPWELYHITPNFPWKNQFCPDYKQQMTPQQYRSAATSAADIKNYSKCALKAVLARGPSSAHTPYWLCPAGAGVATCRKVHGKKVNDLFGGAAKVANGESLDTPPWPTTIAQQVEHFTKTIGLAKKEFVPAPLPAVPAWGGAGVQQAAPAPPAAAPAPPAAAPAPQPKLRTAVIRVYGSNAKTAIEKITAAVKGNGWTVDTYVDGFVARDKHVLINEHKRSMTKGDTYTRRRKINTDQIAVDDVYIAGLLTDLKIA